MSNTYEGRNISHVSTQKSVAVEMSASEVFAEYGELNEYVAVYVPSTIYNKFVDNTEYVDRVSKELSEMFGGATAYNAQGNYVADSGELITESVKIVKAYAEKVTGEMAKKVISLAKWIKEEMQQECVSVEYNGKLMFV